MNWNYPYFLTVSLAVKLSFSFVICFRKREEKEGGKTCSLLVDFRQDCNRSFVSATLGSCEQPQSPAVSIDTVSMGIFWHPDWSKGDSQKWKTRNSTGTNGEKTTCVLISTKKRSTVLLWCLNILELHLKAIKDAVWSVVGLPGEGFCATRTYLWFQSFLPFFYFYFFPTFSPSLQKILWLFLWNPTDISLILDKC